MGMRLIVLTALVLLPLSLAAEIVYLRDGRVVEGSIIAQDNNFLDIRNAAGVQRIQKSQVKRIAYNTAEEKARMEKERLALIARQQAAYKELERLKKLRAQEEEARLKADIALQQKLALERAASAKIVRESVERKEIEAPDEPVGYWGFASRSAIVPGWGHFAIGRPVVGSIYMGATALALYNVAQAYAPARKAQKANEEEVLVNTLYTIAPGNLDTGARIALGVEANHRRFVVYQRKLDRYNKSLGLLVGVYGVQMLHIIVNGLAWESGEVVSGSSSDFMQVSAYTRTDPDPARPADHRMEAAFTLHF